MKPSTKYVYVCFNIPQRRCKRHKVSILGVRVGKFNDIFTI